MSCGEKELETFVLETHGPRFFDLKLQLKFNIFLIWFCLMVALLTIKNSSKVENVSR